MSSSTCGVTASQPIAVPVPVNPQTVPGGVPYPPPYPPKAKCEEKLDREWEQEYRESFSKSILRQRIAEFQGGKYTKRYMETYLDFVHMSGMISNLDYLEFKAILMKE
jgi:hypothetical protein